MGKFDLCIISFLGNKHTTDVCMAALELLCSGFPYQERARNYCG